MIEFEPVTLTDPKIYFAPGACHFSLELVKLFTLYLAPGGEGHSHNRETLHLIDPRYSLSLHLGPEDLE
jgi:hypothetical protein